MVLHIVTKKCDIYCSHISVYLSIRWETPLTHPRSKRSYPTYEHCRTSTKGHIWYRPRLAWPRQPRCLSFFDIRFSHILVYLSMLWETPLPSKESYSTYEHCRTSTKGHIWYRPRLARPRQYLEKKSRVALLPFNTHKKLVLPSTYATYMYSMYMNQSYGAQPSFWHAQK